MVDLTARIYACKDAAREHLEALHWPDGPVCPRCGGMDRVTKLAGKSTRPGVYKCNACVKPFTVTVGTVFEDSKIPLNKWLLATHLLTASKKGMSAHQLHRMLGITYKSAWFMAHRIREAMTPDAKAEGPLGGPNMVVEADETYVGGKAKNRAYAEPPKKQAVFALVEREEDGGASRVMSFHVANVTAKTLRPIIVKHASRKGMLMTDESPVYTRTGREFASHGTVNHAANEYARAGFWHTNTVENYFSIFKRGVYGVYHHLSEAHLHRYCVEFDFRYNRRKVSDAERAEQALEGARGKRLTYRRPDAPANA